MDYDEIFQRPLSLLNLSAKYLLKLCPNQNDIFSKLSSVHCNRLLQHVNSLNDLKLIPDNILKKITCLQLPDLPLGENHTELLSNFYDRVLNNCRRLCHLSLQYACLLSPSTRDILLQSSCASLYLQSICIYADIQLLVWLEKVFARCRNLLQITVIGNNIFFPSGSSHLRDSDVVSPDAALCLSSLSNTVTHLELSCLPMPLNTVFLQQLTVLGKLILHGTRLSNSFFDHVCACRHLRYLDISVTIVSNMHSSSNSVSSSHNRASLSNRTSLASLIRDGHLSGGNSLLSLFRDGVWSDPEQCLPDLLQKLPELVHLDISNTNLATEKGINACNYKRLQWLGALGCGTELLNAVSPVLVAGLCMRQLVDLASYHLNHTRFIISIIDSINTLIDRNSANLFLDDYLEMARIIVRIMASQIYQLNIQLKALSLLHRLFNLENGTLIRRIYLQSGKQLKNTILRQTFRSILHHSSNTYYLQISSQFFLTLDLPSDIRFAPRDFFSLLTNMLYKARDQRTIEQVTQAELSIINMISRICSDAYDNVSADNADYRRNSELIRVCKHHLLSCGVMRWLIEEINYRIDDIQNNAGDINYGYEALFVSIWACFWNSTDEMPENTLYLLEHDLLSIIDFEIFRNFDCIELLRNMMGALGNMAEVYEAHFYLLRCEQIMNGAYDLLEASPFDLEVAYHAGGLMANLLANKNHTQHTWNVECVLDREQVSARLSQAVQGWHLRSPRSIRYTSLVPILRLLSADNYACRLWSMWALASLCTVSPTIYTPMLVQEKGNYLTSILDSSVVLMPLEAHLLTFLFEITNSHHAL